MSTEIGQTGAPINAEPKIPVAQPINNTISNLGTNISNFGTNVANTGSSVASTITNNVSAASQQVSDSLDSFGDSSVVDASNSFLNSNTLIAKFAFLLFVLIAFIFLLNLGIRIIGYFTKPQSKN